MDTPQQTLPDDPKTLKEIILRLQSKVNFLEEQFRLARQKQFGASSEKMPGQGELFNEAETEIDKVSEEAREEEKESIKYTRKKPKRASLPKDLPREEIIHDIPDEKKVCACCNGELHKIGEERSEKLEYVPSKIKVLEHVRPKYACRECEKTNTSSDILIAPLPSTPIPKSIATPSLLSQIIVNKYQFALPLYRQETLFKQHGIALSRKTMSTWMIKCSKLVEPVNKQLKKHLLNQKVIQADETTLKVVHEDKQKCYMWLYCSGSDSPVDGDLKNIVLYDYQASRSGSCAAEYLKGFTGYLQVDGYAGYAQTQAKLVGCMAHARRKFIEAKDAQPKGKTGKADWALNHIQKLYRIERKIAELNSEEKYAVRQNEASPLMENFKAWLEKSSLSVPPKTKMGEAINYTLKQWHKLAGYLEDGRLAIDNNRAERAIKPFVIGRKNWLLSNTASGANASAVLYSVIETAKANAMDPAKYIQYLLTELPKREDSEVEDLMPWSLDLKKLGVV